MREVLNILIGLSGLLAAAYAWNPRWFGPPPEGAGGGERPWRRLGAAICAVTALMFLLGTSLMEPRLSPKAYLLFWAVLLLLVMWLIVLAFRDLRLTLKRYQNERRGMRGQMQPPRDTADKPEDRRP